MKKAFSLIELLVVVVIFMMIFLMTMSFVRLASGSVISARQKLLTNDIRNATETISQKMNNANASFSYVGTVIGGGTEERTVLSFETPNPNMLSIASKNASGTCTTSFFTVMNDSLMMAQGNCDGILPIFNQRLTSKNTKVTSFVPVKTEVRGIPYLKLKITAKDADPQYSADNQIEFQTSYTIDYQTWKNMQ